MHKICKKALAIAVLFFVVPSYAEEELDGYFFTQPVNNNTSHTVSCQNETYVLEYEISKTHDGVRLIKFDRLEMPIPKEQVSKMAEEFANYKSVESIDFACGMAKGMSDGEGLRPADFFSITVRGRFQEGTAAAREACLAKEWEFDPNTRRDFFIEDSELTVDGKGAGYCFHEAGSFSMTIPLGKEKSE